MLTGVDHRVADTARRESYRQELRRRHVPRILLSDGTEPEALATPDHTAIAGALTGTPASAGTVTARVILDPVGAHLEPGEILVAPSTDPGWTAWYTPADPPATHSTGGAHIATAGTDCAIRSFRRVSDSGGTSANDNGR